MQENVLNWFNEQSAWMRAAVNTYIETGEVKENKICQLADICISEAKKEECSKYRVPDINLLSYGESGELAIQKISNIKGVNAIDTDKPLELQTTGINVIYGANGVGKSGYIRIFKMVSGTTYREDIKSNIYRAKKENPECVITVMKDRKISSDIKCNLSKTGEHQILKKIDIFDTKTSLGYVNEEKEATFEPWIFGLFSALGETASKINDELNARKQKYIIENYNISENLKDVDSIKKLEKITYKSKLTEFVEDFSQTDENTLRVLKDRSQIEKNNLSIRIKKSQTQNLTEVLNYFESFITFYSDSNIELISMQEEEWKKKKVTYELSQDLLNNNLDDIDKNIERSNKEWHELWKYARIVFDATKNEVDIDYTNEGSMCPLCHQRISEKTAIRIKTIDEYVNGEASTAEQQTKVRYKSLLQMHPQIKETSYLVLKAQDLKEEFKSEIEKLNKVFINNKALVGSFKDTSVRLMSVSNMQMLINALSDKIIELNNEVENLILLSEVDEQKRIIEEIKILEAKKEIKDNEEKIQNNINNYERLHILDEAVKKTTTNKLTRKSKELAKILITDAYIERFNEELKKLSPSGLTAEVVQAKGKKGKIPYKVQLRDVGGNMVSPKDILSEGESRAVSLAAFFAEASGRSENCPLIIDDPISSLDYEYESRVIGRLIEASQERQVIVFTHRISVVVGISDRITDKDNFKELSLRATKDKKGIPGEPDVNAGRTDKVINKLINNNIPKLKKMDELSEEYLREKHYICQQFRNCVEKSVEEYLIGEVVMRFRKDVQTKRIKYLPSITQTDCDIIDEMMTKYSAYDHSMASETPLQEFEVSEIEADMGRFTVWISKRKSIIKKF